MGVPGVLFIDEVHMLDIECFTYLNRALESTLAPIVIFATNRGRCKIKGTDILSPHGVPSDMLDRLLVIKTIPYGQAEVMEIVKTRAVIEGISLDDDAIAELAEIGKRTSLRYVVQMLTPSSVIAQTNGREVLTREDVQEADVLFTDAKESAKHLQLHASEYVSQ
eukprot:NODE_1609_length_597_cov_1451.693431_g1172_i0.p1 GENE.NODE_1609_length_597_cov_1451.693431_g1172_i0~~NODE_1609_length_597_cov_1451.693431_g1172_i0.p1  ORF type:complete len:176 (-),score=44.51 NODE_1609_length_597_cov_1451.693431_g1172_i0:70-564(-)